MKFNSVRFTNTLLLVLVTLLTLTGGFGLFWASPGWMFTAHRAAGWGLIALLPWKAVISYRSLRRGVKHNVDRGLVILVSVFLAIVTLAVLALALLWKGRFGPRDYWLRQTAISWHWMLALGLLAPLAVHVWRRWPKPKRADFFSRRAALRLLGAGGLAAAGYALAQGIARQRQLPGAPRRFTGSRSAGDFTGNNYPVTQSFAARLDQIDPSTWRLRVGGNVRSPMALTYKDILALPSSEKTATIDCTLGWDSTQNWRGVPLVDLLARAGANGQVVGVRLESVTGYAHVLPYAEAREILLATHVGGEALDANHGFPLRAVVPTRRGWF